MGVTLRYCDLCGNKLAGEALDSPEILKIKDKVFCVDCKPKVLAKLQAQKAAAGAAANEAGASKPAPAAARAPAARPVAAGPVAAGASAGTRAAAAPTRPSQQSAANEAGAGGATPRSAPKPERPLARALKPAERGAPGSPPARVPGFGAPRSGAAPRGLRPAMPRRGAAAAKPDAIGDEDGGGELATDQEYEIRRPKRRFPWLTVVGVIAIGGIGFALYQGISGEETSKPAVKSVAKRDEPKVDLDAQRSERLLAEAKQFQSENPTEFLKINNRFDNISTVFKTMSAGKEAATKLQENIETWRKSAEAAFATLQQEVAALQKQKDYASAFELVNSKVPPVIQDYMNSYEWDFTTQLNNMRMDAKKQVGAKERLDELMDKAMRYAKATHLDIAKAVLDQFDKNYEDLPIWNDYKEYRTKLATVEKGEVTALEQAYAEKRKKEREEQAEKERKKREAEWLLAKEKVEWVPQIPRANLYNWITMAGNWQVNDRVLTGKNSDNATTHAATYQSYWLDFVARFEVRIDEGSLELSPRTNLRKGGAIENVSDAIELTTDDLLKGKKGQWVWITLEVQGETVKLYDNKEAKPEFLRKTFVKKEGDDGYKLLDEGGLLFTLPNGSTVAIRNYETKLVAQTRKRLY